MRKIGQIRSITCQGILRRNMNRYSTARASQVPANQPSQVPLLSSFVNELDRIAPSFKVSGSQIQVLNSPAEFYDTLKTKILEARERIFISTLYLGRNEHELISFLQQRMRANPELRLSILTDALRGTRESPELSCASLLAPLVEEFGCQKVDIRMYHTPNLSGLKKKIIPKRINEGWGLQHMKIYGFDDQIIISGANLSREYFTNRQDRYHLFSSKEITTYFYQLHSIISNLSFQLVPDRIVKDGYTLKWPGSNLAPSPLLSPSDFISHSSRALTDLALSSNESRSSENEAKKTYDTLIYPIFQLTPLFHSRDKISTELPAITSMLSILASPKYKLSSWVFTAGYFNPISALTSLLLSTSSTSNTVIIASPWANGFFGSQGISSLLPPAYVLLSRRFLEAVNYEKKSNRIKMKEWRRGTNGEPGGWTYHAKGLWISIGPKTLSDGEVEVSVVGSSNYTNRSYKLDLEAGAIIITSNNDLKKQLGRERDALSEHSQTLSIDDFMKRERKVSLKVRIAMWLVRIFGGAL